MLLREFIQDARLKLSAIYPEPEAKAITDALCSEFLGTRPYSHILEPSLCVPADMQQSLTDALCRLLQHEPLQYVTGYAEFYGRRFSVSPSVLIPRGETEQLCAYVLDRCLGTPRILDMCTGSGCIAWTLALELKGASVFACDISDKALEVACSQRFDEAERCHRPVFFKCDVLSDCFPVMDKVDVIVSNPPYVTSSERQQMRRNVLDFEPELALFVEDSSAMVFYAAIGAKAGVLLKPDGFCIVEINERFGTECMELFREMGFSRTHILQDLHGKDRFCIIAR